MKVCSFKGFDSFIIEDRPVPEIKDGEILVKTSIVGICGTDVHKAVHQTVPVGTVLGHEISGTVEKVGQGVSKFKVGDRVAIAHHAPCMSCKACLKGNHSLCEQYLKTNVDPGGFSEYIRLPPENVKHTVKLMPATMKFEEGAFMEPLACCLRGFHRLEFAPGDDYLIIGMGPIGLLFCMIAKAFNAGTVTGVDLNQFRLDFARNKAGADFIHNPKDSSWEEFANTHDLPGFSHVIVNVGLGVVYQDAFKHVGKGTNVLFFAQSPQGQQLTLDPNVVYNNELSVLGSYSSSPRYLTMALDMIASGDISVKDLITNVYAPEQIQDAINLVHAAQDSLKVMIKF
ncbi:MAG: alcohol dehydrogenase catalytic domain-containing protein [Candidatus Hodarchaeota archaeon]